uniref:Uncharacterized protein n=2 Tax=Opuntia streptacantha TaxID=393608 RepID=A0A7C9CQH4_OPUST
MATILLWLLFLLISFSSSPAFAEELTLVVGQSTALLVIPKVPVSNSPGSKPGVNVVAERVHVYGLSRMKNLKRFSHSVLVKVSRLNSSLRQPNVEVCFHRNLSLGIGMCPQNQWQNLPKDPWARKISPFDHKLLDIRMASSSRETLEVTIEEEFSAYRMVLLVLGSVLIMLAPMLSESLVFYYSSAMATGIILVILIILFQGMKLLPTGQRSSLALFIYSSVVGIGSFLLRYLPRLFRTMLSEIGISEDMYYPLAIFFLLFISLAGAWLGFWAVRKLILTEDGSIDTTVSHFVAWSIWILGAVMILQCSLDPLLAAEALVSAIFVTSVLRRATRPRLLRRLYRKLGGRGHQKLRKSDLCLADGNKYVEHINDFHYYRSEDVLPSPQSRWTTQVSRCSAAKGSDKKPLPPYERDNFYSTYHKTPERRKYSDDELKAISKEYTKKGLEELVSSPEFSKWAVAHAERITLAPIEKERSHAGGWRRWFSWFR